MVPVTLLGAASAGAAAVQVNDDPIVEDRDGDDPIVEVRDREPAGYIVEFTDAVARQRSIADAVAQTAGVEPTHRYSRVLQGFAAELTPEQRDLLLADPSVKSISPDTMMYLNGDQTDPTWGLDRLDARENSADSNYHYDYDGTGVHLYPVDSGINSSHEDFAGRIGVGIDIIDDDADPEDCSGHGTHVSGTAGGTTYGVAKNVTIHPVRTFGCAGGTPSSVIIAGLEWIAENHIKPAVVNMSLGGARAAPADSAVEALVALGVVVVVAAGNDNTDACRQTPANERSVITVGATAIDDERASFSNWGTCVDIFAPGSGVLSASLGTPSATRTLSGTSMASPHVAGLAALILEQHPTATPQQVMDLMIETSTRGQVIDPYVGSPDRLLYSLDIASSLPPTIEVQGNVRTLAGADISGSLEVAGAGEFGLVAVGLPDGVQLSPAGVFSGAAVAPGRFDVEVTVAADSRTYYRRFQWHVVTTNNQTPILQDFPAEVTVLAGTDPYFWFHVNDPDLDFSQISFSSPTLSVRNARDGQTPHARRLQITDIPLGVHTVSAVAFDERGAAAELQEMRITAVASFPDGVNPEPGLQPQPSVDAVLGEPLGIQLRAVGSEPDVHFGISQLPPGMTLNTTTGLLSGRPEAIGFFELRATISNLQGQTATLRFTLRVEQAEPPAPLASASVRTACVDGDGQISVDLDNPTDAPVTFTVSATGQPDGEVTVASEAVATREFSGLSDGPYLIEVIAATTVLLSVTEDIACDPPVPELVLTSSCTNEDGRIDIAITNVTLDPHVYRTEFDGRLPRAVFVPPGFESSHTVTGRRDGPIVVEVFRSGESILVETVTVACDVVEEIEVAVSCLAGNGRVDVFVTNVNSSQSLYEAWIGSLSVRRAFIAPGTQARLTATGRQDGYLPIVVAANGVEQSYDTVIDCDPSDPIPEPPTGGSDEVSAVVTCLAFNGRVDVFLRNFGDAAANYSVLVGTLAPRDRTVAPDASVRVTVTGRRDGPIDLVVLRDGAEVFRTTETITCDA